MPTRRAPHRPPPYKVLLTRSVRSTAASALVIGVVAAFAGVAGCGDASGGPRGGVASGGPRSDAGSAHSLAELADLTVAPARSMKGYSRSRFPHWARHDGGCDTRDLVLKRDGTGVKVTGECVVSAGRWHSPYDEKTFRAPRQVDIDHLVPLANAWRSGADTWDDDQRSKFANDLVRPQLLAVSATANRAKGDQDPSLWLPDNRGYWCQYARSWVAVKLHWRLTVTAKEKSKITELLRGCS